MTNAILSTILNAMFTASKKVDDKKVEFETSILGSNWAKMPKKTALPNEVQSVWSALEHVYEYMEAAATASTDNQRNKAVTKAQDNCREYLKAIGFDSGIGNITVLLSVFAAKKQTSKKVVKGGYTTKTTFIKYCLYLSAYKQEHGYWCEPKSTAKKAESEKERLWAQMEANKKALEAEKERTEIMSVIIAQSPELQAQLAEMLAKVSA